MNLLGSIFHFLGGIEHGVENAIKPKQQPKPAQKPQAPPPSNLAGFLHQTIGPPKPQPKMPHHASGLDNLIGGVIHSLAPRPDEKNNFKPFNPAIHAAKDAVGAAVSGPTKLGDVLATPFITANTNKAASKGKITWQDAANSQAAGLKSAGFNPNDKLSTVARKGAGIAFNTASLVPVGAATGQAVKFGAKNLVKNAAKSAAANAVSGVASEAQKDNPTLKGYAKSAAEGAAIGAAFPVVGAAGGKLAKSAVNSDAAQKLIHDERGFIAGPGATSFDKAASKGKTFLGPDGIHRFEVSDAKASLKTRGADRLLASRGVPYKLGDILDHKALYKEYPDLKNLKLVNDPEVGFGKAALYDPKSHTVRLNPEHIASPEDLKNSLFNLRQREDGTIGTLMHEVTHRIQDKEKMATGSDVPKEVDMAYQFVQNKKNELLPKWNDLVKKLGKHEISSEEFEKNPIVHQYRSLEGDFKKAEDEYHGALNDYRNIPGEREAQLVEDRIGMSQRELDKNPVHLEPTPMEALEYSKNNPIEPMAKRVDVPKPAITENQFTKGVKTSPEVSPEVQGMVSGQHEVRNTKELIDNATAHIDRQGLDKATEEVLNELAVPEGQVSDETFAKALALAAKHDAKGTEAGHQLAASIYDQVSGHAVKKGQEIQILSMLARRSPAGLRNKALRDLKKAGVQITPDIEKMVQGHIDTIRGLEDGPVRDMAIASMQKEVQKLVPQKKIDQLTSLWKAGLLSGTKTQGGNAISNTVFGGLRKASDLIATGFDQPATIISGKRSKSFTLKGIGSGGAEGVKTAKTTLKTGIDPREVGDKYEQHAEINFQSPIWQKVLGSPANMVFRAMKAADQPFFYSALKNTLYDLAKVDGLNKNLSGQALRDSMEKFVKNPPEDAVKRATLTAQKAVLGQDSKIGAAVGEFARKVPGGQFVTPFTKVPTNFIAETLNYTPAGAIKEVGMQVLKKKEFDQRDLVEALGKATTGSGVIWLGSQLANANLLSGDYPNDPTEAARWKAEGITPNSVRIGNTWYSLNYLGPIGLLFGAGKNLHDAAASGDTGLLDQATQAAAGLGKGLTQQSFLQGLSGFSNAIQDPGRYGKNLVNSEAGSVVPSLVNDLGNISDPLQRQANSPTQAIEGRIPLLRQNLTPKKDVFGNPLPQAAGSINAAVNPLKPSQTRSTPLTNELDRLKDSGQAIFPTPEKTLKAGNATIKLDSKQQDEYNTSFGQKLQDGWSNLIKTPAYQALADDKKKQALSNLQDDLRAVQKYTFLKQHGHQQEADALANNMSKRQVALLDSGIDLNTYTADKKNQKAASPAEKYQEALKKFNTDSPKLTAIQRYERQASLNNLKIQSSFPQDVLDFYHMSKAKMNDFFKTDPAVAKSLYDQAKQLDQALGGKKFKHGLTTRVASSKGKKRGGKVRVHVAKVASIKSLKIKGIKPKHTKIVYAKPATAHAKKIKFGTSKSGIRIA